MGGSRQGCILTLIPNEKKIDMSGGGGGVTKHSHWNLANYVVLHKFKQIQVSKCMPGILGSQVVIPNHKAKLHKQAPKLNHADLNSIQKVHKGNFFNFFQMKEFLI